MFPRAEEAEYRFRWHTLLQGVPIPSGASADDMHHNALGQRGRERTPQSLDGKAMENGRQLHVNLYRRLIGDVIALDVLRDGQTLKIAVAMTERHDPFSSLESADPRRNLVPRLGILGVDLDQRIAAILPVLRVKSGVVVASTAARGIDARDGGLAAGDVVYAVNKKPIVSVGELRAALDQLKSGDSVVLHLERRGELMFLAFTVE